MKPTAASRRWLGPPLALQIMGLLLAGLVVAQGTTLALTLLLPPEPQPQWDLEEIAQVLAGRKAVDRGTRLQRTLQAGPPEAKGPGWLLSDNTRRDLARLLERPEEEVRLYFYTPLPFAGTGTAANAIRPASLAAREWPLLPADAASDSPARSGFLRVQAGGPGGGMGGFGGFGGGRRGGPGFPDHSLGRQAPDAAQHKQSRPTEGTTSGSTATGTAADPAAAASRQAPAGADNAAATPSTPPAANREATPTTARAGNSTQQPPAAVPAVQTHNGTGDAPRPGLRPSGENHLPTPPTAATNAPSASAAAPASSTHTEPRPEVQRRAVAAPGRPSAPAPPAPPAAVVPPATEASRPPSSGASRASRPQTASAQPVEVRPAARGLFGLAPAPFVEGDFVAAVHTAEGSWAVVQPIPEPFPNAWQRRVLLWFAIAAAVVLPAGWLFSRRLVRPISGFAQAAERLGRDPSAPVLALEGPAEIGRAAQAFNRMQSRLRSFVDDRTVMIGAISHDLRTPLTRMRFRIEDVPEDVRTGMLEDVDEMEQMIGAVLAFIRDASTPGTREQMDFATLVDDVVEQAVFVGKNVRLEHTENAPVDVDAIGMRRVLDNLIENAVKYGTQARVRLFREGDSAVAEISDRGPGIADDDLARVFQPFYRTPDARASGAAGSGLGLAVCRSIARAHGGDVELRPGPHGLVAQLRVPLAMDVTSPA